MEVNNISSFLEDHKILGPVMENLHHWLLSLGFNFRPTRGASAKKGSVTFDYFVNFQKNILCNLQIKDRYIQFGFRKKQFQSLGLLDELKDTIKEAWRLTVTSKGAEGETPTGLRIFIDHPNKSKLEPIKNILEPLLKKSLNQIE
jgi:hypothetical protein